jgi:hypothetical protein
MRSPSSFIPSLLLAAGLAVGAPGAVAETPGGIQKIHITFGTSKLQGKNPYALEIRWRPDNELNLDASALINVKGSDQNKPDDGVTIAKLMVEKIGKYIYYELPSYRGVTVEQVKENGKLLPEILIVNKTGFAITQFTALDWLSQKVTYDMVDKTFGAARAEIAIDVQGHGEGGPVSIAVGGKQAVETDGKDPEDVESAWLKSLPGASLAGTSLVIDLGEKNNVLRDRPFFDGQELRLNGLNEKAFTLDMNNKGLGTVVKFRFPDENKGLKDAPVYLPIIAGILALLWAARMFWRIRKPTSGTEA